MTVAEVLPFRRPAPKGPRDADTPRFFERGDQKELADMVVSDMGPGPLTHDVGEFWRYAPDCGVWRKIESCEVQTRVAEYAGASVVNGKRDEVLHISASTASGAEKIARNKLLADPKRYRFADAPAGFAFANGFVTVRDGKIEVLPHAPENLARHRYEFDYAPWAVDQTPQLGSFFVSLFQDIDEDDMRSRVKLVQEVVGACLLGEAPKYQRCLIIYATGGNGKSELLYILRGLFPADAVVSVVPQKFGERFIPAMLDGKRANLVDELPDLEIMGGDAFKGIITGEPITMERKGQDPFTGAPVAGHIYCTNTPITTADHSEGFWRRPAILHLSHYFDGDPERELDIGKRVLSAERSAIVAWAIEGAARLQRQGGYTIPESSKRLSIAWRDASDQVRQWARSQPANEERVPLSSTVLYERYKGWAKDNGVAQVSHTKFAIRLAATRLYSKEEKDSGNFYTRLPR